VPYIFSPLTDPKTVPLIKAVVAQASIKGKEEIAEMEKALAITADMHLASMHTAKAGMTEAEVTGKVHGIAIGAGGNLAYPIILTVKKTKSDL